jgi:acyl-CoA thioester hydrolase
MLTHTSHLTVRHYECDAYGHVNNANYLRYMEHAAIEASAAVGFDDARYRSLGAVWLIHETDIEYLQPLLAGDHVEIKTWVADFRRVRSQRQYEFWRAGDDALAARAVTDWVYLDRATQKPIQIPPEVIAAYAPDGIPDTAPRQHLPDAPPPPPKPFTLRRRVEWRDIDMMGHVNNATYLNYMEEAAVESVEAFNWSMLRLVDEDIAIVARRHQIQYQQPAKLGEELLITTYLADIKRASAIRHFHITRASDGETLARAVSYWVFMHPSSGQVARVPDSIRADFAEHIAGG